MFGGDAGDSAEALGFAVAAASLLAVALAAAAGDPADSAWAGRRRASAARRGTVLARLEPGTGPNDMTALSDVPIDGRGGLRPGRGG